MPIVNDVLTIYDVFKLLAMVQGAFVLGIAIAIAFYYFKRTATENRSSWSLFIPLLTRGIIWSAPVICLVILLCLSN
jgi:hypothetical protein